VAPSKDVVFLFNTQSMAEMGCIAVHLNVCV